MIFIVAALIVIVGVAAYFYVQNHGFSSMIWKEVEEMAEGSPLHPEPVIDPADLPEPVRRYLAFAIPDLPSPEFRPAGFARLRHGGDFRLQPGAAWLPIRGAEYFLCSRPAFIWTATVKQNALAWFRARDKYARQRGQMLVRLRGALPLIDAAGPDMDRSSLIRYLSEMPWFPTAFLTVPGLTWKEIDPHTVEATLRDDPHTVTGRFTVDDSGAITAFATEERTREVNGAQVRTAWKGLYADYRAADGVVIPHRAEVLWELPEEDFSYARFAIEEIQYDIPAPF